jgi:hypothetical protein
MTDKVENGSVNPAEGSQNQAQSSANTETEMPEWAKELNAKVDEALGQARAAQGKVDQTQHQLNEAQSSFAEMAQYLEQYPNPADAERAYKIDKFMQSQEVAAQGNANPAQQNAELASQTSGAGNVDPELLVKYGVDPQSPEYLAQVEQGKVGFEAAMAVLSQRQIQQVEGAATGASGGTGGSNPPATQQEVLRQKYQEELDAAQAAGGGVLKPHMLYNIQEKYVKLGLQGIY